LAFFCKESELPPLSTIAKAGMLRELQYCAAFRCLEELYRNKGMKKESQEEFMYSHYHGDNICRGSLDELIKGDNRCFLRLCLMRVFLLC
jgi:hypothetical protein